MSALVIASFADWLIAMHRPSVIPPGELTRNEALAQTIVPYWWWARHLAERYGVGNVEGPDWVGQESAYRARELFERDLTTVAPWMPCEGDDCNQPAGTFQCNGACRAYEGDPPR